MGRVPRPDADARTATTGKAGASEEIPFLGAPTLAEDAEHTGLRMNVPVGGTPAPGMPGSATELAPGDR